MPNSRDEEKRKARERFRRRVRRSLDNADQAFRGEYSAEIDALLGLSRAEIDAISPGVTDLRTYDELIAVVKEASRVNLAQADLANRIRSMGELAVAIAKKVPSLSSILG